MWFSSVWTKAKKIKKDQFFIILLSGVLLLVIAIPTGKKEEKAAEEETQTQMQQQGEGEDDSVESYTERMEERLETVLASMEGVGCVKVMITLEGGKSAEVLKDTPSVRNTSSEADSAGGTRTSMELELTESTVYTTDTQGNQIPYVRREAEPEIRGILVVAEGGGNPVTVTKVTEAAEALFQIEPHRIRVMKMKIQG